MFNPNPNPLPAEYALFEQVTTSFESKKKFENKPQFQLWSL